MFSAHRRRSVVLQPGTGAERGARCTILDDCRAVQRLVALLWQFPRMGGQKAVAALLLYNRAPWGTMCKDKVVEVQYSKMIVV